MDIAYIANSNVIEVTGLKNEVAATFINDADVTVTVKTKAGVSVTGQSWPTTMDYVAASNGNYRATLSENIDFVKGHYVAFIDADGGAGLVGHWEFPFDAETRTGV